MYDIGTHVSDTILTGWHLTNVHRFCQKWKDLYKQDCRFLK